MLQPAAFFQALKEQGITFFTGVPDSLLKDFCAYVTDHTDKSNHIITANEGNAVALAAGRYLAAGQISLVYLQNSGLGNIINPLTSLTDPLVYGIPVLLLIGWRGQPGVKDEPQHAKQGQITLAQLEVLGIKYALLPDTTAEMQAVLQEAAAYMQARQAPYALVVRKGSFAPYSLQSEQPTAFPLNREEALHCVLAHLSDNDVVVSTTGKTSRELYEYRQALGQSHARDFLTVGSMGHATQIALGIACGYRTVLQAASKEEISEQLAVRQQSPGPALLEIKIRKGARADLGRPRTTPQENKAALMQFLAAVK